MVRSLGFIVYNLWFRVYGSESIVQSFSFIETAFGSKFSPATTIFGKKKGAINH